MWKICIFAQFVRFAVKKSATGISSDDAFISQSGSGTDNQQSAINNQQSAINNQQSAINNQ